MSMPHPLPSSLRAKLTALLIALLGAGGCGSGAESPGADTSAAPDLIIEEVTVIDAVNGAREGMRVVVDEGRIAAVESAATPWEGAEPEATVAGEGAYLIPGLWDFHVHLSYDARFTDAMPEMFLRYGITSVRDTGGMLDLVLPIVERMEAEGALA
ncbi:MAG: hypothetical protein HKN71_07050, partial [Gemmatimonadetes bacterium]|nr:hypothetical protein [Gemmatimonadota bacterium]